jgi:hypothetical protein
MSSTSEERQIREIGAILLRRHRSIGKSMARRIRAEVPEYEAAGAEVVADLESLAIETSRLLGQMLSAEAEGDRDDLAPIRRRVARRIDQGIALEPFLHAYRVAQGEYWEACSRVALSEGIPREVAIALGSRLHEIMDTITSHAAEGYLREELRVSQRQGQAARDLVERLIAGRVAEVGRRPAAAPGLDLEAELSVAVARIEGGGEAEDGLESFRAAFEGAATGRVRPLLASRQGELVVIAPAGGRPGAMREALDRARGEASPSAAQDPRLDIGGPAAGRGLRIGLSGVAVGAGGVARAYREALLALSFTTPSRPVLALVDLGSLNAALAGADLATRQVIAARGARLLAQPETTRAAIAETVRAFAAAALNVTAAAADLGVHPNTLRYRLGRIADQTGHDPRTFEGLVELVCILELGPES